MHFSDPGALGFTAFSILTGVAKPPLGGWRGGQQLVAMPPPSCCRWISFQTAYSLWTESFWRQRLCAAMQLNPGPGPHSLALKFSLLWFKWQHQSCTWLSCLLWIKLLGAVG